MRRLLGLWKFNDASNLGKATLGTDGIAAASGITASAGVGGADTGAATIPVGNHFTMANSIGATGLGGTKTPAYTIMMDVNLSVTTTWHSFLEIDNPGGSDDGDYFLRGSAGDVGFSGQGYVENHPFTQH